MKNIKNHLPMAVSLLCLSLALASCGGGGGGNSGGGSSSTNAVWSQTNWDQSDWQ